MAVSAEPKTGTGIYLDIPKLGSRDYIHGTSLWTAMLELSRASYDLRLDIRKPMRSQLMLSKIDPADIAPGSAARFQAGPLVWRLDTSDRPLETMPRRRYDDVAIAACGKLANRRISGSFVAGVTTIEAVVAFQKRLCEHVTGRQGWWFARLSADLWLDQAEHVRLEFERGNDRLVQSRVILDGSDCAEIIFHLRVEH